MFVEPHMIDGQFPRVTHGCPNCSPKVITLVLVNDQQRFEYTLLVCERVAVSYVMDLYALFTRVNAPRMPNTPLKSVNTLRVHDILEPYKWLQCIQWTRYQQQGQKVSMEWFITRPNNSGFYYSLGEGGSLLVSRENNMEMIQIHPETVRTIAGLSTDFCTRPTLQQIDFKNKLL
ncbi:uncharacterized protein TNCT_69021 [Trichonephila clavata]|uniref:Uncharacterized protein n=1 Tax=Trichonephila clavata TaxID=2740835 RepID=A0A8X6HUI0_TRICU|nr:uncharacterized protein TNCT_69021 [Trichonephila clavata]